MKKYAPWIKAIVVLAVVIFLFAKLDPFSRIKNDPVDILNQSNLSKNVNINTVSPDSIRYSERVKLIHPSIDELKFDRKTGVLKISYEKTSHVDGQMEVRNFAYQSANVLQSLKDNNRIKAMEFSQEVNMNDAGNVKNALYAYFDRKSFDSINYSEWKDKFRKENMYPHFYNRADKYRIYSGLQKDMEEEAKKELNHSKEIH